MSAKDKQKVKSVGNTNQTRNKLREYNFNQQYNNMVTR